MHPQVIRDKPGECPICHMELTPLKAGAPTSRPDGTAAVTIDPAMVQNMGIRTAEVTRGPLRTSVRAVGYFVEAEPNIHDVNLRLSGWVEKLHANTVGMHVQTGDPLFDLYSPQLQTAVEEMIAARRSSESSGGGDELSTKSTAAVYQSSERKLLLLGVQKEEVARLAKLDRAPRTITYTSPVHGHVTEKFIVEGAAVKEGEKVLRIVDHSTLWLDAQIYESQLPFINMGQKATATVVSMPGKTFEGKVIFVHPHVDPTTRTVMVRLAIPNETLTLRPGMYGTVQIAAELADQAVLVPREAVIDTGTRQIAFLAKAECHFEARNVKMGVTTPDGMAQILDGLSPGETVVTSGQFLLDAESRIKEAILKHLSHSGGRPGGTRPPPAAHEGHAAPAGGSSNGTPANPKVDPLVKAYLGLSDLFGKPQEGDQPADVQPLVAAAEELSRTLPPQHRPLAENVAKAATTMKGHPMTHQRALFKPLSAAVIALVDEVSPSDAVADKLVMIHCPMADEDRGADWLQVTETVANPYFPRTMKRCGEVKRTIELEGTR
jgi:RND family efflux transporter MFP subunit